MITVYGSGVTLEALREIEPVTPEGAGGRWKPIQHGELVDTIKDEVLTRGWRVIDERFATARAGADMAGALLLDNVAGVEGVPGQSLALGILHSNARRKALQLTVGAEVACCTNGMCTGTIVLNRVHDHTVDLVEEIEVAVEHYAKAATGVSKVVARLQKAKVSDAQASEILMEAGRRRLVGWAAVGRVDAEYRQPTYQEHGTGTAWALLNAFTYAARPNIAPTRQMEAFNAFRLLLPGRRA